MNHLIFNLVLFSILTLSSPLYAGQSVCPDGSGGVSGYSSRGNANPGCLYFEIGFNGIDEAEYNHVKTLFKTVPQQHIKIVANSPEEMTSQEKTAVNDAMASAQTLSIRNGAKSQLDGFGDVSLYQRAFADILKDEINILRAQHGLAPRTLTQLKNAIKNRVDDGSVDT